MTWNIFKASELSLVQPTEIAQQMFKFKDGSWIAAINLTYLLETGEKEVLDNLK